jgi:isoamylase
MERPIPRRCTKLHESRQRYGQASAYRLFGSPDIYGREQREPEQSVNFVTCHDGFTLNDLVSYQAKHNEANRANNRDGADTNLSWNCGTEGPVRTRP